MKVINKLFRNIAIQFEISDQYLFSYKGLINQSQQQYALYLQKISYF